MSLVAALIIGGLAWLVGRRQAALAALLAIAGYTVLTGASPTVVRAAIMGGLFVVATVIGRPTSAATSITLAAAVMTGWHPLVIEDVSFQLSFAAILGIVYLTPGLQRDGVELLRRWGIDASGSGLAGSVVEMSAMTAGAVAATLPLIALTFGRISLVALVSNLFAVPAFPLILGSSALTAIAGAAWAPLGDATAWFSWAALTYLIEVARFFAAIPFASFSISGFGSGHAAAAYVALAGIAWWLNRRRPSAAPIAIDQASLAAAHLRPAWLLAGVFVVLAASAWWSALQGSGGRLTVSVLDVGQGDAILIETPDGRHILVDGGADGRLLAEAMSRELPFSERTLDLVALTHPQEDHMLGLIEALRRYDVRQVLASPVEDDSAAYREWRELIRRQGVPYAEPHAGEWIDLGEGATLQVLGPARDALGTSRLNDASLVLRLAWRDASFLLTGDIETAGEEALLAGGASDVRATVLKVAHHGSLTSSSPAFLRAARPAIAVVSVGEENPYGHPSRTVLDRLGGTLVLRTDRDGTVRLSTDGERLWVEPERAR